MATKQSNDTSDHLKYKTWILKVSIHCEGCKKKVHKILHNIDGVFTVSIDSLQHKVSVTGNIEAEKLIKKLERAGKHAELVQENVEKGENGNKTDKWKKKKKKKNNAANVEKGTGDNGNGDDKEDILEKKDDDENEDKDEKPNATENGDKKKKKKGNKENTITEVSPTVVEPSNSPIGMMHLGPPYGHLYPYYPTQSLGLSYSTSHPSGSSSYYASPMYAYNASSRPPPPSYQIRAYNNNYDHDEVYVENDGTGGCSIM